MLSTAPGKKLTKYVSDYVVFDLETTGVSCKEDEIIEISAVKVVNGIVVDEFSFLVNPNMLIPYSASSVNGITNDMVKDSPSIDTVLVEFIDFVGDFILVGHNIHSFDLKFINRDTQKYFGKVLNNDYIDTVLLSRICLPDISHCLSNLAEYYGYSSEGAHRALADCRMNQEIFEELGKDIENPSRRNLDIQVCSECGNLLKLREGKYGRFWGCTDYPNCKHTLKIR